MATADARRADISKLLRLNNGVGSLRAVGEAFDKAMTEAAEMSFKQMCTRFDVTPRTLRYYEYIELLRPRKDGRARWYGPREVARMTLILRGRRFGFTLEQIRQWLDIYGRKGTREQYEVWLTLADGQLAVLDGQMAELQASRDDLAALRAESARLLAEMEAGAADHGKPAD